MLKERARVAFDPLAKLKNPLYLPTHQDILDAFETDPRPYSRWVDFCQDPNRPVYELLNQEFIDALSGYLAQRVQALSNGERTVTILEIGAGDGRLSHFLDLSLRKKIANFKIITTDSGYWKEIVPMFSVEVLNHEEAIQKYQECCPMIVIVSWMPYSVDWTSTFRDSNNVVEYILIGESQGGCCGDGWLTWGIGKDKVAPFVQEGFKKDVLQEVSDYQICRSDVPSHPFHSSTVSFKRI